MTTRWYVRSPGRRWARASPNRERRAATGSCTLLRRVKFRNGDPVTTEDVKFSFDRYKSGGASASAAGIVVPKKYLEQVGDDAFKQRPIGR